MNLRAKDLMTRPVKRLKADASVREAAALLLEWGFSGAPVEDPSGRWVGMFSLSDLARHVQGGLAEAVSESGRTLETRGQAPPEVALGGSKVSDLMTGGLYSVFPEATLAEVARAMTSQKVHRVIVLSEQGAIEGIVTAMDVLRRLA